MLTVCHSGARSLLMRAGQFTRPEHHNKPILWDGCKCGEGGAVGTSHKILTGILTGIYTAPSKPPTATNRHPNGLKPITQTQNFPANCYVFVTETTPNTAKTVLKWGYAPSQPRYPHNNPP